MPTVKIVPTSADIENFDATGGATIEILGDNNINTYYRVDNNDSPATMNHMQFSTDALYDSSNAFINGITVHIEGKVMMVGSSITTTLFCTEREEEGIFIQPSTVTFLSGTINEQFQFTNLAIPLQDTAIDDGHIDTLEFNLATEGDILITELYVMVDYSKITEGRIEINNGFVELIEGHLAL